MASSKNDLVDAAIADVNELNEADAQIENRDDFPLLGGGVDSLTFINLISAIEDRIQNDLGQTVVLVDESLLEDGEEVFSTVGNLKAYVASQIG